MEVDGGEEEDGVEDEVEEDDVKEGEAMDVGGDAGAGADPA